MAEQRQPLGHDQSKMFSEKNGKDYLAYMESYFLFVPSSPENFSTSAWVFRKYFEQAVPGPPIS